MPSFLSQVFPEDEGHWAPDAPGPRLLAIDDREAAASGRRNSSSSSVTKEVEGGPLETKPAGAVPVLLIDPPCAREVQLPSAPLTTAAPMLSSKAKGGFLKSLLRGCLFPSAQKWETMASGDPLPR